VLLRRVSLSVDRPFSLLEHQYGVEATMLLLWFYYQPLRHCLLLLVILGLSEFSHDKVLAFQAAARPWTARRQPAQRRRRNDHFFAERPHYANNRNTEDEDDDDDECDSPPKAYGNRSLSWTNKYRRLLPYEYARNRVMSMGLRSKDEWDEIVDGLGPYLPNRPDEMYADEWVSWNEFLGIMRSYEEAQYMVRFVLQLKSMDEYNAFVEADKKRAEGLRIPAKPHIVYKDKGWESFDHFFGIHNEIDDNGDSLLSS